MALQENSGAVELRKRQSLLLPDIRGTTLRVTRGTVWITQENDTRDVVLGAGETWTVERDGITIAEAQTDSAISAAGPAFRRALRGAAGPAGLWRHLREKVESVLAAAARKPAPYY